MMKLWRLRYSWNANVILWTKYESNIFSAMNSLFCNTKQNWLLLKCKMAKYQQKYITSMCLQNLELFAFPRVLAFPNASKIALEFKTFSDLVVWLRNSTICFTVSVLPDPVTPVMSIDCDFPKIRRFPSALFARISSNCLNNRIIHHKWYQ